MGINTLTLKTKLIFALTIIAGFTVLTSTTAILLFSEVKREINALTGRDIIGLQQVLKISESLRDIETTLEAIRTDYRIHENNNNIISLNNSWQNLSSQITKLKNNDQSLTREISLHTDEINRLIEQLPNLSQVLFDLMEARLTSAFIHKDVITQHSLLHSQLSNEIRSTHNDHVRMTYNNRREEDLAIMNKLIEFHDKSTDLSSSLLSAFDENNILNLNNMGRSSLTLFNSLSTSSQSFPPNALVLTKRWLQQVRRLLVGDTSIFTLRRTETRLANIIDTLLDQHVLLARKIDEESKIIASTLYKEVNASSLNLTEKLAYFSKLLIILSIICLTLAVLIIWLYLGRKIFRPIENIKSAMIKISNGNTETELPKAENNEVGDMVLALSKLKEHVSAVTNIAQYDGLTSLFNRREFDIALNRELRRCKREGSSISLLLCDIDFFKHYNDNYGHIAGDKCLIRCTKEMKAHFNRVTDLCFRYGGEEFAIIMVGIESVDAYEMAEKLRRKIAGLEIKHSYSECADVITFSFGIVHAMAQQISTPQDLLAKADKQLYLAKDNGRNRVQQAPS